MPIYYKLHYRENKTHPDATGYFAVISKKGTMTTDEIADSIQQNCSLKRSDVVAVLAELGEIVKNGIQQSRSVKIDGLGTFSPGISSARVTDPATFDQRRNIRKLRVNFLPEQTMRSGRRTKDIFDDARLVRDDKTRH